MRASAVSLIRRGIAGELGNFPLPFSPFFSNVGFQSRSFARMLRINFRSINDVNYAVFLFREMARIKPQPSAVEFNKLLRVIVKMEHYEVALSMFDEMRQLGGPVNECTMNIAMDCYCVLNRVGFGFAILGSFFKYGYEPDAITFATLLNGLLLDDKVVEAEELFERLLDEKLCEPNEIMIGSVINGLIDGYCLQGRTDRAKEVFDSMEDNGLKPSICNYGSLINGYCKKGKVDEAWRLFLEVPCRGLQYTTSTYNTMIHGLFREGRFADGWKLFKDMEARQVHPDLITYNILLDGLFQTHPIANAISFLRIMEERGVNPDVITYSILINGLCKEGRLDLARDIFNQLPSKGLQPNVRMYTLIIGSLCQEGFVEAAIYLLKEKEKKWLCT